MRSAVILIPFLALLAFSPAAGAAASKDIESIPGCTLVPTEWADGDSFQIRKPDGTLMTVRLYGVDCMELHVNNPTDSRRLRAQRRYFGITEVGDNPADSIDFAQDIGKQGAEYTARLLERPFTLHTHMHKALGDGKHQRFYGFIETADGKDLATELVRTGLARAFGVSAAGPGNRSRDRYKEMLSDIELRAARRGSGVWASTDWDKLPEERDIQRLEDEEDQAAQGRDSLPDDFRIDPNTASRDDLERLPGIGEKIAINIIEAREDGEFKTPEDLIRVSMIGDKKLEGIRQYLVFE